MKTESHIEFNARMKSTGLDSTFTTMVDDFQRQGFSIQQAAMKAREELTPEDVELSDRTSRVERNARARLIQKQEEHEAASTKMWSIPKSVQWAFDHMEIKILDEDDKPGATALVLWKWLQKNEVNKSEFIKSIWSKLMPSQKELDNQARYSDDGSKEIELAERILARMNENVT